MVLPFSKYQGAGNDFILLDDRTLSFPLKDESFIRKLCCRRLGVGADGLILLQSSSCADFRMRIFNSDGLEASMCGNGIRCLTRYLQDLGFKEEGFRIETERGVLFCSFKQEKVSVRLPFPVVLHWAMPVSGQKVFVIDTGVPHAVVFVEDLEGCPVEIWGRNLRFHPDFAPHGVNVNFIQVFSDGIIGIRTYERGVEGETLACGTGAAAAAFVLFQQTGSLGPIQVKPKSGEVMEFLIRDFSDPKEMEMIGSATHVFNGAM